MNRARIATALALALGIALAGACSSKDGDDGGPNGTNGGPGTLSIVLDAASNDAAAIEFTIAGSGITNVQAVSGLTLYQRSAPNGVNLAVVGSMGDGPLVTFDVPDVNATYTVTVVDVADNTNSLLTKSNYTLSVQS